MPCSNFFTPYDGQQWLTFPHPHRKQSGQSCTNRISASNPVIVLCGLLQPNPRGNALWEIRKDLIHNGHGFSQEYILTPSPAPSFVSITFSPPTAFVSWSPLSLCSKSLENEPPSLMMQFLPLFHFNSFYLIWIGMPFLPLFLSVILCKPYLSSNCLPMLSFFHYRHLTYFAVVLWCSNPS